MEVGNSRENGSFAKQLSKLWISKKEAVNLMPVQGLRSSLKGGLKIRINEVSNGQ